MPTEPAKTIGSCATLAAVWEATAAKPGNVYRGADFDDLSYADFLTSAVVIGPIVERAVEQGVGATVLAAVRATQLAVATNTNLGILLLVTPLAACGEKVSQARLADVLDRLTIDDTRHVYQAIREARPGGLGEVDRGDVHSDHPAVPLREVMQLAADRDLVARQYTNNFEQVFRLADQLGRQLSGGQPVADAVVHCYLQQLSEHPDSLVARKCGAELAGNLSARAAAVLASVDREAYAAALADFDFWLRADGHRRNPGTTADLVAAALFVVLMEGRLSWPVRFYQSTN